MLRDGGGGWLKVLYGAVFGIDWTNMFMYHRINMANDVI